MGEVPDHPTADPPSGHPQRRPIVTLAALYGSGGGVVGRLVAERLGVEFLDPELAQSLASEAGLPDEADAQGDPTRSRLDRFTANLGRLSTLTGEGGGAMERLDLQESALRGHTEAFIARSREDGGVVLGLGGMVVLRSVPWALHVHLRGPRNARVRQAASLSAIDVDTAARRQRPADRARLDRLSRLYGVDGRDSSLYHLVLDSTAMSLDTCVGLIVLAAKARADDPRPRSGAGEPHDA